MRWLAALGLISALLACLATPAIAQATSHFAIIEIRLVAKAHGGGPSVVVEGTDKSLEVESEPLMGPTDFASVGQLQWVEGKPGFNVALTPAGVDNFEKLSAANVGRTLAIIVDGKIVTAPKILDPLHAQGFLLTFDTEADAKALGPELRQAIEAK